MAALQVQLRHQVLGERLQGAVDKVDEAAQKAAVDDAPPHKRVLKSFCDVRGREFQLPLEF